MQFVYQLNGAAARTVTLNQGWNLLEPTASLGVHWFQELIVFSNAANTTNRGKAYLIFAYVLTDDGRQIWFMPNRAGGGLHVFPVRRALVRRAGGYPGNRPKTRQVPWLVPSPRTAWTAQADGWLQTAQTCWLQGTSNGDIWHFCRPLGGAWFPYGAPDSDLPGARGRDLCPGWENHFGWSAWRFDRAVERLPIFNLDAATGEQLPASQTQVDPYAGYYSLERGSPGNGEVLNKVCALFSWYTLFTPSDIYDDRRLPRRLNAGTCDYELTLASYQAPNGQHLGDFVQHAAGLAFGHGLAEAEWALRCVFGDCEYAWTASRLRALANHNEQGSKLAGRELAWVRITQAYASATSQAALLAYQLSARCFARIMMQDNSFLQCWPGIEGPSSNFNPYPWVPGGLDPSIAAAQAMEHTFLCKAAPLNVRQAAAQDVWANAGAPWRAQGGGQIPHFFGVAQNGVPLSASRLFRQGDGETFWCWHSMGQALSEGVTEVLDVMERTYLPGSTTPVPRAHLIDALVANADPHGINPRGIEQTGAAIAALEQTQKP